MNAFIVDRYSKKDPMRLGEIPQPELRDDDVLIEVHAAGVNLLDCKIKSGEFKLILPYRTPKCSRYAPRCLVPTRESSRCGPLR